MAKIDFKYQGEVVESLDPEVPEEMEQIVALGHKGIRMNKVDNEFAENKKQLEYWNGMLANAKNDPEAKQLLVDKIESHIGQPLTEQEKETIIDNFDGSEIVSGLKKEIEDLKKETKQNRDIQVGQEIKAAHAMNEEAYKGKDGYPVYDKKAIEEYLQKNPIYTPDITRNYQIAYEEMHKEAIEEAKKTHWVNSEKGRKQTIKNAKTEDGSSIVDTPPKEDVVAGKSWDDLANEHLAETKKSGESLMIDD